MGARKAREIHTVENEKFKVAVVLPWQDVEPMSNMDSTRVGCSEATQ
jgi:hypothetical protein